MLIDDWFILVINHNIKTRTTFANDIYKKQRAEAFAATHISTK